LERVPAKKSLGQHFLTDGNIARKIVDSAGFAREDIVIEIGPGLGALTELLIGRARRVIGVELDRALAEKLREKFPSEQLQIIEADILKVDIEELARELGAAGESRFRIIANLPYNISTPAIQHLINFRNYISDMTLMLQKEVVQRIVARPGGKEYGLLSVIVQYYCAVEKLFDVPPGAFRPAPKVYSSVVRLAVRERAAVDVIDEEIFFLVIKSAFAQRRKTLLNNLKGLSRRINLKRAQQGLREIGIDPGRRAETLSLAEFARLANFFAGEGAVPRIR